jgi:hypothetical protein
VTWGNASRVNSSILNASRRGADAGRTHRAASARLRTSDGFPPKTPPAE